MGMITYQQDKIFEKFKPDNKFINVVTKFKISKTTINFKIGIVKYVDENSKIQISCISLYHLKNIFG